MKTLKELFSDRNIRIFNQSNIHIATYGFPRQTKDTSKDIKAALKDNKDTDKYLIKRFKNVSIEGVNI